VNVTVFVAPATKPVSRIGAEPMTFQFPPLTTPNVDAEAVDDGETVHREYSSDVWLDVALPSGTSLQPNRPHCD
jgi:hypothetical protein